MNVMNINSFKVPARLTLMNGINYKRKFSIIIYENSQEFLAKQ